MNISILCRHLPLNLKFFYTLRFQLPAFDDSDEDNQMMIVKEAAARHGIRAKLRGDEIFQEDLKQAPKFLLSMEHYPKVVLCQYCSNIW